MSNDAGPGENNPLPYRPAWTESTPPHGHEFAAREPAAPHVPVVRRPRVDGRASRRAAERPRRGRTALIATLAVLLIGGGTAAGGWWYVHKDDGDGVRIHEGDCLRDKTSIDADPVPCEDPQARFIVVERVQGTTDTDVCDSLPGDPIALVSDPAQDRFVLCLGARK